MEREIGELTATVKSLAKQIELDRAERKEHRREINYRLNSHAKDIKGLQRWRNIAAGFALAISSYLGYRVHF